MGKLPDKGGHFLQKTDGFEGYFFFKKNIPWAISS